MLAKLYYYNIHDQLKKSFFQDSRSMYSLVDHEDKWEEKIYCGHQQVGQWHVEVVPLLLKEVCLVKVVPHEQYSVLHPALKSGTSGYF